MKLTKELIAKKMGITHGVDPEGVMLFKPCPDFLTDMNAAMMVVEKMREKEWKWLSGSNGSAAGGIYFEFYKDDVYREFKAWGKSLPTAICTAALKAMEAS